MADLTAVATWRGPTGEPCRACGRSLYDHVGTELRCPLDLTDDELDGLETTSSWLQNKPPKTKLIDDDERRLARKIATAVDELRRHRATMKRLEKWARALEIDSVHPMLGRAIANELRKRMKGDSNG